MRPLLDVTPTPEQLAIFARNRPGIELIRGAAGSGKTTTAILRLRSLISLFVNRRRRQQVDDPVRVLVLTFNRTLRGYIHELATQQISDSDEVEMEISTFAKWAMSKIGYPQIVPESIKKSTIIELGKGIRLLSNFLYEEVDYAMGRFLPDQLEVYLTARRDGRGASPRVDRSMRVSILNDVINPYLEWKEANSLWDWNDLAVYLAEEKLDKPYDIIITDETQDFSANQIRAVRNQLAETHFLTLIVDSAQRIYARGFTWQETGIAIRPQNIRTLRNNYRNTIEIALFAEPLIRGLPIDDDGTLPDFSRCQRHGRTPIVLKGRFRGQAGYVLGYIQNEVNLENESVAILHPLGGGWFNYIQQVIQRAGLNYIEITRESEWPEGDENIAFSTLHSSKGLEFDHVIIIGLNREVTIHGEDEEDDRLNMFRRLLAMGVGRARESVIIGYKPEDVSTLINYLDSSTYEEVNV